MVCVNPLNNKLSRLCGHTKYCVSDHDNKPFLRRGTTLFAAMEKETEKQHGQERLYQALRQPAFHAPVPGDPIN